jgi:RNA polymerase sigma-70 factor, ECF subfamily
VVILKAGEKLLRDNDLHLRGRLSARRGAVKRKLARRRFDAMFHASPRNGEAPARGLTPGECAILARLYEVLERLPADQRLAWSLRYLEGEGLEVVASTCGCSLSTAKRRVGAAKSVIEEGLRDE